VSIFILRNETNQELKKINEHQTSPIRWQVRSLQ
jgi:hypothetical protein